MKKKTHHRQADRYSQLALCVYLIKRVGYSAGSSGVRLKRDGGRAGVCVSRRGGRERRREQGKEVDREKEEEEKEEAHSLVPVLAEQIYHPAAARTYKLFGPKCRFYTNTLAARSSHASAKN